jgi:tRNA threonylcarbamoyladenosine biosynthesis protein TsaB
MLILSVDTALGQESCALLKYGEVIGFSQGTENALQAEKLFDHINEMLNKSKLKLENIDYFAADIGPGSFTGTRIGLSAILGVCMAQNKKFVGVSSLEALAYKASAAQDMDSISVALDAGKNEAYFGEFEVRGKKIITSYQPILVEVDKILTATIGNIKECKIQAVPTAKDIGNAAHTMIKNNIADFNRKAPMYIRKPEAEIKFDNVQ